MNPTPLTSFHVCTGVAQTASLLYRRLPVGRGSGYLSPPSPTERCKSEGGRGGVGGGPGSTWDVQRWMFDVQPFGLSEVDYPRFSLPSARRAGVRGHFFLQRSEAPGAHNSRSSLVGIQ